jgi:copper resistance protein C
MNRLVLDRFAGRRGARRLLRALAFAACAQAGSAHAHAFLERATPAVGSTVHAAPAQVSLRFTQRLEAAFSKLQVQDARGKRVDKNNVALDADQTTLSVAVPALPPGRYVVKWRVLSVDTHVTEGDFSFQVQP